MTQKTGLTGNIGSGKSLVARIFETLRVPVFYADAEGKKLLGHPEVIAQIRQLFGEKVTDDGKIDRKALAQIVFSEKSKLEKLNQIIHPAVRRKFSQWAGNHPDAPYVIYEAAILHESGHYKNLDTIIVVAADENLRIHRVMSRDGVSEQDVRKRMANQWPEEKKIQHADFVINNNEKQLLIPQVLEIHRQLT